MKTFTIKRSKWLRGDNDGELHRNGKMCCLGFVSNQCGVPKSRMSGKLLPESLDDEFMESVGFLLDAYQRDNMLSEKAVSINDDSDITEKEREKKLKALFRKHKIALKFVD